MSAAHAVATGREAAEGRESCARLDARDPLASLREAFVLPEGLIYLDGNSLGPLPRATADVLARVVEQEWGGGLIRSWNEAGWIDAPRRVGAAIAPLVGAASEDVIAADSTSINLYKLLVGALQLRPERRVIVSEIGNFPTDLYMAQGLNAMLDGRYELRFVEAEGLEAAIDDDLAVLMLTHVDYRSGQMHDMAALTGRAHDAGGLALWDLAHSAGAVPVDLRACDVDLAVGCGYKYLNGGPGAPAFLYVAPRWQARITSPLSGWLGHRAPFEFSPVYRPAEGIRRQLCGTPPILAMSALEAALELWREVDMDVLRAKSVALAELFIARLDRDLAGLGLSLASPREAERRGSQVSLTHPDAYPVMQALIDRGVIGDFREPDVLRFGLTPLYTRYVDVWDAAETLREILVDGAWDRPAYHRRAAVT